MDGKGASGGGGSGSSGGGRGGGGGGSGGGGSGSTTKSSGGAGSTTKSSGAGGSAGGPMMKAPGGDGANISREAFESNPKAYFSDLHAAQKTNNNK